MLNKYTSVSVASVMIYFMSTFLTFYNFVSLRVEFSTTKFNFLLVHAIVEGEFPVLVPTCIEAEFFCSVLTWCLNLLKPHTFTTFSLAAPPCWRQIFSFSWYLNLMKPCSFLLVLALLEVKSFKTFLTSSVVKKRITFFKI